MLERGERRAARERTAAAVHRPFELGDELSLAGITEPCRPGEDDGEDPEQEERTGGKRPRRGARRMRLTGETDELGVRGAASGRRTGFGVEIGAAEPRSTGGSARPLRAGAVPGVGSNRTQP